MTRCMALLFFCYYFFMKVRPDFLKDLCAPPQNKDLSRSVKRGGERRALGPVAFRQDVSRRRAWKGIFQVVVVSREGKRVDVAGEGILPGIEILFCNRLIIFFQYALHIVPRYARAKHLGFRLCRFSPPRFFCSSIRIFQILICARVRAHAFPDNSSEHFYRY